MLKKLPGLPKRLIKILLFLSFLLLIQNVINAQPIKLHPENPHYFLYQGKPTMLITSAEHYGAVINLDFDYITYLNKLKEYGFNYTRIIPGTFIESANSIAGVEAYNTLAPKPGRLTTPWARSTKPGYANGGNKFDLNKWNTSFFTRLKDFVYQARIRGIVVEVTLFSPYYKDLNWNISPLKSSNNINGVGTVARNKMLTLENGNVLAHQEKLVRKIVLELNNYDNVFYEICNEPYWDGVTMAWQNRMISTIVKSEAALQKKHLIALNVFNHKGKILNPNPAVSIFNYHYAETRAVHENYHLNKVIGYDETGFIGTGDDVYRKAGWRFMAAGGAIYNNLDWSFTPSHETGAYALPSNTPGGGSHTLRRQIKIMKDFLYGFNFIKMKPNKGIIKGGIPSGAIAGALVEEGKAYAIHISGGSQANLSVYLPSNTYQADWINTKTGAVIKTLTFKHSTGNKTLGSPSYSGDIALRIKQKSTTTTPAPITSTTQVIKNGIYQLAAKHSGKILEVSGVSKSDNAAVQQYSNYSKSNQKWKIEHVGSGYYKVTAVHSGKSLTAQSTSLSNGTKVVQLPYKTSSTQLWKIESLGSGYYKLTNKVSGNVLQIVGGQVTNGTDANTWDWVNHDRQKWKFNLITTSLRVDDGEPAFSKDITIYPNPAQDFITINYLSEKAEEASVTITDLFSNRKFSSSYRVNEGENDLRINTSSFENGVYLVQITVLGNKVIKRLTINR